MLYDEKRNMNRNYLIIVVIIRKQKNDEHSNIEIFKFKYLNFNI